MNELTADQRTTRHGLRNVETAIQLRDGLHADEVRRERRMYALAGLMLTTVNVVIAVAAVAGGGAS